MILWCDITKQRILTLRSYRIILNLLHESLFFFPQTEISSELSRIKLLNIHSDCKPDGEESHTTTVESKISEKTEGEMHYLCSYFIYLIWC